MMGSDAIRPAGSVHLLSYQFVSNIHGFNLEVIPNIELTFEFVARNKHVYSPKRQSTKTKKEEFTDAYRAN